MNNEFIFPIRKVFSKEQDGVLGLNMAECYYIAPYQRGYKWGSSTRYEQVPQMLIDIYDAKRNGTSEYYLQYITLKRTEYNGKKVFEVIDGQQRLTTLSLLFYRLNKHGFDNIAKDMLVYARHDASQNDIFDRIETNVKNNRDDLTTLLTQDEYYMTNAALTIDKFLCVLTKNDELDGFVHYLEQSVMLIVNQESEFIESEQVFVNLNDNKVPLTDTYLIKGLLLTNAVERENIWGIRRSYKEILDQRSIMGRTWDEIMMWISKPDVAHYFFGQDNMNNGMFCLLSFVYDILFKKHDSRNPKEKPSVVEEFVSELKQEDSHFTTDIFPLFNRYNEVISSTEDAIAVLHQLKHVYLKFRSVYENYSDCSLFNLLGFVLFAENVQRNDNKWVKSNVEQFRKEKLEELVNLNAEEFMKVLYQVAMQLIPDMEQALSDYKKQKGIESKDIPNPDLFAALKKYNYSSNNAELKNLLLSLSVFCEERNPSYRFDFCQYDSEAWSFEHIFPQHPSGKLKIPSIAVDIVCRTIDSEIAKADEERKKNLDNIRNKIKDNKTLEKEEINALSFLYDCDYDIHLCGNMALLSGGVNSALSNNPFVAKRPILLSKINAGSFVPQHTMNVFNKILVAPEGAAFVPELSKWTELDVVAHMKWQIQRNTLIRDQIKSKL